MKTSHMYMFIIISVFLILFLASAFSQITSPDGYRIDPLVIDSGGGSFGTTDYSMVVSVGQAAAGSVSAVDVDSDIGFLAAQNYASYDFDLGLMNWTFSGQVPPYDKLTAGWSNGHLDLTTNNNTNSFGFWYGTFSVELIPASLFRMVMRVSSDEPDPSKVPVFRYRYLVEGYAQSGGGVVTSTVSQDEPTQDGVNYFFFFKPAEEYFLSSNPTVQFTMDVYNFDPFDAVGKRVSLEHLNLDVIDDSNLGAPSSSVTYTFDSTQEEWTSYAPTPFFESPVFSHTAGALYIITADSDEYRNEYGYWVRENALPVAPNKLYRMKATCRTDASSSSQTPQMMIRALMGDYHHSTFMNIYTSGNPDIGLTSSNKDYYLYIVSPSYYTGNLITTFDLLNFDPQFAAGTALIMDACTIEEFTIPEP